MLMLLTQLAGAATKPQQQEVALPNHVAVGDMAFVFFAPSQIDAGGVDTHNASAICRMLPARGRSAGDRLEDHAIICFSDMEQHGVRFANDTRLSCFVEHVQSSVDISITTPVLQNSCVLHPVLLPFDGADQAAQADRFVADHADVCRGSAATEASCRSIDNRTYMGLLAAYNFRDDQIVVADRAWHMSGALLELAVDFIKYYWKKT